MSNSPNAGIPYVPQGTLDPAAGLNLAIDVIDVLLQTAVIDISLTAPPGGESDGDLYIVGSSATGDWAGQDNNLARYVSEGDFWQFFEAGTQVKMVRNRADGSLYVYDIDSSSAGWTVFAGGSGGGGGGVSPVVNESGSTLTATATNDGNYTRFSHSGPTYVFDDGEGYTVGAEYHGRYVGSGTLTITEAGTMTINPPADGSLDIPPGGTFTVKIVASNEADLFGLTAVPS